MCPPPKLYRARSFCDKGNGSLSVIESSVDLPFQIRRVYYVYGVLNGNSRGFHGHKELSQLIFALHGSVDLKFEGHDGTFLFHLSRPDEGVLVPPGYWREMHNMAPETVLMVLASEDFSEDDYIRDYHTFSQWLLQSHRITTVPYIDLSRYHDVIGKAIEEAAVSVFRSCQFINGPCKTRLEADFARMCGTRHAIGVGNGLEALVLILEALGVGSGHDVLVCAAGFIATPLAVSRVGARPVFVDCDPGGNIAPDAIEAALTPTCKAILLTHLYGLPADMDAINAIAAQRGIAVIEDACQAHGARYKGRPCGGLGTAAAFSFYPTKNLGGLGDGGCVVTNDDALAEKVHKLGNYGSARKYHHEMLGTNSRLDELQAAMLLAKLPHLEGWNANRRRLAQIYLERLAEEPGLALPEVPEWAEPVWHVFAVRVKNGLRDQLAAFLHAKGIGTNIHYPLALHQQVCYTSRSGLLTCPESERQAAEVLSLPLDALHSPEEIRYVADAVCFFFDQRGVK